MSNDAMNNDTMNYDPNTHKIVRGIARLGDWYMGHLGLLLQATQKDVGCRRMLIHPRPHDLSFMLANAKPDEVWTYGRDELYRFCLRHGLKSCCASEYRKGQPTWIAANIGQDMFNSTDWRRVERPVAEPVKPENEPVEVAQPTLQSSPELTARLREQIDAMGTVHVAQVEKIIELERQLAERDRVSHELEMSLREKLANTHTMLTEANERVRLKPRREHRQNPLATLALWFLLSQVPVPKECVRMRIVRACAAVTNPGTHALGCRGRDLVRPQPRVHRAPDRVGRVGSHPPDQPARRQGAMAGLPREYSTVDEVQRRRPE